MDPRDFHLMNNANNNDFELYDFTDEANFDQFIDLIRGENEDQITAGFDSELINGLMVDNQFSNPNQENVFNFSAPYITSSSMVPDDQSFVPINMTLPSFEDDGKEVEEDNDGEEGSSGTTTTTTPRKAKTDRSRTLISERRRRGRMKEKLYALRSLVPNITKVRS